MSAIGRRRGGVVGGEGVGVEGRNTAFGDVISKLSIVVT